MSDVKRKRLCSPGSAQAIDINDPHSKITLLEHEWRDFRDSVIPLSAAEVQRDEMRRAFYAGAQAVLNVVGDAMDNNLDDGELAKILPAIEIEIERFIARFLATKPKGTTH